MWYEVLLYILLLALGFVLLSKGSDVFVDGSASVATKAGIPQLVIGLTIVAMGTSAPEAAVSISSAIAGSAEIAVGNVVGSNILNVLIILGLTATIVPLAVRKVSHILDIPMVLLATATMFVIGLFGFVNFIGGIIMLLLFVGYMAILFINAKKPKKQGEMEEEEAPIKIMPIWKSIIFIVLGLAMIVFGSNVTVDSATSLARIFGVSERFIALTIVALGTSLPELFTSVTAAIKGNADIAVGNILGSNIFNILFILGITSIIIPVPFESKFLIDTAVSFASVLFIFLVSLKSKKIARWAGITMLTLYAGYFVYLILV